MSLDSTLFSDRNQAAQGPLNTVLHQDLNSLVVNLKSLIDIQPKPFIFLKSNNNNLSSNVADGVMILPGVPVPAGARATIRDFNVNFTTVAGTVRLVIIDASGTVKIDILRSINSSVNGIGQTVLEEGEALAIVGQSAGAGTFSVYCSGDVQRIR